MGALPLTSLDDLHYLLGEINGKVNLLVAQGEVQDNRHSALDARVRALEAVSPIGLEPRVRTLENRQHWYAGGAAALGAAMTYIIKGLTGHT